MYLCRLALRTDGDGPELARMLTMRDEGALADIHHRLLASLHGSRPGHPRDFLWRYMGRHSFLTLSAQPPDAHAFFAPHEVKVFQPAIKSGDRLHFVLRANITRDRSAISRLDRTGRQGRGRRVDVIAQAIRENLPGDGRALNTIAGPAAAAWLHGKGALAGFSLEEVHVERFRSLRIGVSKSRKHPRHFGITDLRGSLTIDDPALFRTQIGKGFGRAKAFGCGLMLIAPVAIGD